ncbi:hypothetical protein JCM3765_002471 [Sporobolomyces pararoseus]
MASSPPPILDRSSSTRTQALVLLTLQNASVSILTRYSLSHSNYSTSVAVLSTELIKALISLCMLLWEEVGGRMEEARRTGGKNRHVKLRETSKEPDEGKGGVRWGDGILQMTVPAALYSLQNKLLYTALSNLSAEIYQTTYQLKLVTTAIFSILFFKTRVSRKKWFSLFLLTLGVIIVQLDKPSPSYRPRRRVEEEEDRIKGFGAIFLACISSGLAGSYFEKVLKSTSPPLTTTTTGSPTLQKETRNKNKKGISTVKTSSLWIKNLQLSIPSLVFASIGVYLSSTTTSTSTSTSILHLWKGFTPLVWFVVLNQALGGLLVALVVRDSSSIDKGFATSIAIILSTLISWSFDLGSRPGGWFLIGAGAVITSTVLYSTSA